MRRALPFLLALSTACGPSALRDVDAARTISLGGESRRRVETLTDLEEVRGVAVHEDSVYVATDGGLLRYASGGEAAVEVIAGVPSDDVRAVIDDGDALLVATGAGLVRVRGNEVTRVEGAPDVGAITAVARTTDGTLWLGGLGGLARRTSDGAWQVFGEPVRCTTLAPTPEGQLWVGTTAGLWYVEGDVIREHGISGGIPEGYVRAIVPVLPGKILALVQGPSHAKVGYWDGERWSAYTVRGLNGPVIGLVRRGTQVLLVGHQRVIAIAPSGTGVGLAPLASAQGNVRSFRARITAAAEHTPSAEAERDALQPARPIAPVPENQASVSAPSFVARPLDVELPGRVYASFVQGSTAFLAVSNGGLLRLPENGAPRALRSLSLVPEETLQLAADGGRTAWMITRGGRLAKYVDGRFVRSGLPSGLVAQAVASGPQGAYLLALEPGAGPAAIRLFQNRGSGWAPLAQRNLTLPTPLVGVPFMGVSPNGAVWAALRVRREDGPGERMRGFAVIDPSSEAVVLHHRAAERPGLPVPDEVSSIDFDTDGNAWVASLSGLVRVGDGQAVVFGEARGVRGEVVSDAAVGNTIVWLTSAEGLGAYDRTRFDYAQPPFVQQARPMRLAADLGGAIWATSPNGLLLRQGEDWRHIDTDAGLPTNELLDVQADSTGRVWLLASDRLLLLAQ